MTAVMSPHSNGGRGAEMAPSPTPTEPVWRVVVEYDGSAFVGFQRQPRGRTVQGELERALSALAGAPVVVHPAGRTDTGVHATGQVISFRLSGARRARFDAPTLVRALNGQLDRDIAVREATEAPADFHARFSARRRLYRYRLYVAPQRSPLRRHSHWHLHGLLDVPAMQAAADSLIGEHDFAAFSGADPAVRSTVRRLEHLGVRPEPAGADTLPAGASLVMVDAVANAFLPHMVRNLVGLLVAVGQGRVAVADVAALLAGRDRRRAPAPAPPHGLTLVGVDYGDDAGMPRAERDTGRQIQ